MKLIQDTVSSLIIDLIVKKIILYILVTRNQIGNIFHIINVGIDILVHLLDDRMGIFRGVFKNGSIRKPHGNSCYYQYGTQDQNRNSRKNNTLNTAEFAYKSCRQTFLFHLRFSLAYSVGVYPVIFLNEIPK